MLDPGTKYISKVLDSMKEGVLKITKKAREMHKELGLDHHYENILSDEWLNSEYQTFSCQVRGKYIEWKHKRSEELRRVGEVERVVTKIIRGLHEHLMFVKHDKKKGITQVMCKEGGSRLMALSIQRQERFVERGTKEEILEEMQSRMRRLLHGTYIKGWKIGGKEGAGAIVRAILTLYQYEIDKALQNPYANELTGTFKSHKDIPTDKLFRVVVATINRVGRENLFRMLHNGLTGMLVAVLNVYKGMSEDVRGEWSYNTFE